VQDDASIPAETRHALGLADTLIRLSPGIESSRDLIKDLIDGLDALGTTTVAEQELVGAQ
jgi:cystathionine beta-lyase/cystathionine gamma-synthase